MSIQTMMHCWMLCLCFFLCDITNAEIEIIETKYGKIEADVIIPTETGFPVSAFKGIPYGKAGLFEKSEPPVPWTGVKQTKAFPSQCPQHLIFGVEETKLPNEYSSDDCLYLNVFTPFEREGPLLPVMFWIHGGGFAEGSTEEFGQAGIIEWLVPKGVIVVTINYRLGPWGFFSTGDENALGNYGLWDMTLALRWTNENIDRFGGDPKRVTIFGESAGGTAVSLLTLSPHSRDLFQQTIVMSGSSLIPWIGLDRQNTIEAGDYLSKSMGCGPLLGSGKDTKHAVECIKKKSMAEILEHLHKSYRPFERFEMVVFSPVYDGDFFPDPFEKMMEDAPPKRMISGVTNDEAGYFSKVSFQCTFTDANSWAFGTCNKHGSSLISITVTPLYRIGPMDIEWVADYNGFFDFDRFLTILNVLFPEEKYQKHAPLIRQLALHHYVDSIGDRKNRSFLVERYKALMSDYIFLDPQYKEALMRYNRGSPVWLYIFDYYDNECFLRENNAYKGVQHYLELAYLFKLDDAHCAVWKGNELKVMNVMTTLWTNFAKYGDPNPEKSPYHNAFTWDPINDDHLDRYLRIGLNTRPYDQYCRRTVSFWMELLPRVQALLKGLDGQKVKPTMDKTEL